jgi:hypothetical protein
LRLRMEKADHDDGEGIVLESSRVVMELDTRC